MNIKSFKYEKTVTIRYKENALWHPRAEGEHQRKPKLGRHSDLEEVCFGHG